MARRNSWASYVIWGCFAVSAVLGAALALALLVGSTRGIQIAAPARAPAAIAKQAPEPATAVAKDVTVEAHEVARLKETLSSVAAERDRLAARLERLEQSGDITASVSNGAPASPPRGTRNQDRSAVAVAPPAPDAASTIEILRPYATVQPLVGEPAPEQAAMQIRATPRTGETAAVTRTAFAIDLGAEPSLETLRMRWSTLRGDHAVALADLTPLVSVRDDAKSGVELRLLVGPFANAEAAARTCAVLQVRRVPCQTATYEGQRLALR